MNAAAIASRLVTVMIVVNVPVAVWCEVSHAELAERVDAMLLGVFGIEIGVRAVLAIRRRRWDTWLVVDTVIVALAALPYAALPVVRVARVAHLGRHIAHLRHATLARLVHA
ncbi:hypothetical protein [Mycobacterium conspicuum]|uniref:Uncharacterized protein n=1 Tax=Mycobacterium conspicuum TaxID=44010 RepID=A0A1X1T2Y4_9MYCO|nr:hypothetical protein [Mycobacterium conspicuum]ORV38743.1 hypothetical protein AWC00_00460 [Mycobacterium conspicuum]BBZ41141.1 hypothetical protein MCNS_42040 [Mycobacterium conspicuum]